MAPEPLPNPAPAESLGPNTEPEPMAPEPKGPGASLPSAQLPPFPALGSMGGDYWYEARPSGNSGAVEIKMRWRAVEIGRNGKPVMNGGKPKVFKPAAYAGRWSAEAREGLPDDPEIAKSIIIATAEAYRIQQGIVPNKEEKRYGSSKAGQSKRARQ